MNSPHLSPEKKNDVPDTTDPGENSDDLKEENDVKAETNGIDDVEADNKAGEDEEDWIDTPDGKIRRIEGVAPPKEWTGLTTLTYELRCLAKDLSRLKQEFKNSWIGLADDLTEATGIPLNDPYGAYQEVRDSHIPGEPWTGDPRVDEPIEIINTITSFVDKLRE